jgi:hypothetical protein
MRDDEDDGLCPVADKAPALFPQNELTVTIFNRSQGSSQQIEAEKKTVIYIRPTEVETLMRVYEVPTEDRARIMDGVFLLEGIANQIRPNRKKKKK